jgi:hypothetical protein
MILGASFSDEVAFSIGKQTMRKKQESVFAFGFLGVFWGLVFILLSSLAVQAPFTFSAASLPTLSARIALECLLSYMAAMAVFKADRSTNGFVGTLTIPLLLIVDLRLGYQISRFQIAGIVLLAAGVGILFLRSKRTKKGVKYCVAMALLAVITASLYKYDISHFNSVAVEQGITMSVMLIFFSVMAAVRGTRQPVRYLLQRPQGVQSVAAGLAVAVQSYAFMYAPASVIIAMKRGFALIWSIVFGHKWFHEHKLKVKLQTASVMLCGLFLLALH